MTKRTNSLALCGALLWASAGPLAAQDAQGGSKPKPPKPTEKKPAERFDLNRGPLIEVGQRIRTVFDLRADFVVTVRHKKKPVRVDNKRMGHELDYVDQVQATNGSAITKALRTYQLVHDWETGQKDKERRQVEMVWSPAGLIEKPVGGAELPELAQRYIGYEKESYDEQRTGALDGLIPERPVAIGHRWKIPWQVGARFSGIPLESIRVEKTRCVGILRSIKFNEAKTRRWLLVVFAFRLALSKFADIECYEDTHYDLYFETWVPARGRLDHVAGRLRGKFAGGGRNPDFPPNVDVTFEGKAVGRVLEQPLKKAKRD
ncbi:MAG TPA: hypothetical protein DEA08_01905 [Planctomycetes bacterium]|nr:hypothetical protein [Planctomycetota bacterium]